MIEWQQALKLTDAEFYLDSRLPQRFSFVSHAHSDHLAEHEAILSTPATFRLAEHRSVATRSVAAAYGRPVAIDDRHVATLFPAGHVLGSAMLHVAGPAGTLLYTGDFKLRAGRTCEPVGDLPRVDYLLTESTYGLPHFRFPPPERVAAELVDRCAQALSEGRQPIAMGYSLGKAQEIVRILTDAGLPVTAHGAVAGVCEVYEALGMPLGPVRRYAWGDFHGRRPIDLAQRGVLVAPPQVARTAFVTAFDRPLAIMLTGWAMDPGAKYRYGVDLALPLSDHADFDELLELIDRVRPRKVFTHHGFPQFVDHLRQRGIDAALARPDPQLSLFD